MADTPAPPSGVLEISSKGFGFLRDPSRNYLIRPADPYVGVDLIRRHKLSAGIRIGGPVAAAPRGQQGVRLLDVTSIEGQPPSEFRPRNWNELTAVDPTRMIRLETAAEPLTTRVMDLFTPIGFGQRGLIVAPPRSGKTVLLQHIAAAIAQNYPECYLIVLLVDERPEEVTEIRRSVRGEVVSSSSDQDSGAHIRISELVVERARRLTEQGRDTIILMDSLTRLARAYNKHSGSGRTMSGGVDSRALEVPKRLFGAARAFEEGGSLTVLGTCLIETGSRMDEVIFQEFKGTGNMELVLDRALAEKRIWPAIDLLKSGTRKEERILSAEEYERITLLRRSLFQMRRPEEAMDGLIKQLTKTTNNREFLDTVGKFLAK